MNQTSPPAGRVAQLRILHVMTRYELGGTERNVRETVKWELSAGSEVDVVVGRDSAPLAAEHFPRVRVLRELVRQPSPIDVMALVRLRRLIASGGYDIVHTHQAKAGVLGRLAAYRLGPEVWHTVHMPSFGPGYKRVPSLVFQNLERLVARNTDRLIFVGEDVRRFYDASRVGRSNESVVLRSTVDVDRFAALRGFSDDERAAARARLGHSVRGPVALALGALEPRKRPELMLAIVARALREGLFTLVYAGDGPRRQKVAKQALELGVDERVVFTGHVDAFDALAAADVLVHAAQTEGVPQVLIQALAAGVPVIATESVGIREVNSAAVRVVPPNGAGLAEAVLTSLSSPPPPCPIEFLSPWRREAVDDARRTLYSLSPTSCAVSLGGVGPSRVQPDKSPAS